MFLSYFILFSLLLSRPFNSQECVGYDKEKQLCVECSPNMYRSPSFSSQDKVNPLTNCFNRSSSDLLYSRKVYVSNETCANTTSCLGTKSSPYDNLIKTIIEIQNNDMAEKYLEQNIEIYLLGSPHYILSSDLLYQNMRLFRRMNATIKIGPLFCENEYAVGCIFGFRNERIDLYIKTFGFSFEIYGKLTIYNLNIFANDIVLSSLTSFNCYNVSSVCCSSNLLNEDNYINECGLNNRTISLSEKTKISSMRALFQLRILYDDKLDSSQNLSKNILPSINLTNILFENMFSVQGDSSWLSFIMINTLGYQIFLNTITIRNSFFPYGIIFSITLEDDPYYNYLTVEETSTLYHLYPNSDKYSNLIMISYFIVSDYQVFSFALTSGYTGSFSNSLLTFSNEQNPSAQYIFSGLNFQDFSFIDLMHFFSYLTPANSIFSPFVLINDSSFINIGQISIFNCEYLKIAISNSVFNNCILESNPLFSVNNQIELNIMYSLFTNLDLSQSSNIIISTNSMIVIEKSNFMDIIDSIGIFYESQLILDSVIFSSNILPTASSMLEFSDSNFIMKNVNIINCIIPNTQGILIYFYATKDVLINSTGLKLLESSFYEFLLVESYVQEPNIYFENTILNKTYGVSNSRWSHFFFLDCGVGASNKIIIKDFYAFNIRNLELLLHSSYFQTIKFINLHIVNETGLQYYFALIYSAAETYKGLKSSLSFENVTIDGLLFNRSLDLMYLGITENVVFSNSTFKNIRYDESLASSSARNNIVLMQYSANFLLENSYIEYTKNSFFIEFFSLIIVDNITVFNNIFQGIYDNTKIFVPAMCAKIFLNFVFVNNTIKNMSLTKTPMDVGDETGVISVLPAGDYSSTFSSTVTTVTIINNYFYGNIGVKFGVLGIVGANYAYLINNTFELCESYYGGAIAIYSAQKVLFESILLKNCTGFEGGGIYLYLVLESKILDLFMFNISSSNGGIYFYSVENAVLNNVNFQNLTASQKAAALYIYASNNITLNNSKNINTYAYAAGCMYIESSNVTIQSFNLISSGSSQVGGAFYIIGLSSSILMKNNTFIYCHAGSDGIILSSLNIQNLTIVQTYFLASYTETSGNGVINLGGFYIVKPGDTENFGSFIFKNNTCMDNIANLGGCLYYSSNNFLIVQEMIISNISGSVFNIESDNSVNITFSNISIEKTNYYSIDQNFNLDLTNPSIVFINLNFLIEYFEVANNIGEASLIKISTCVGYIRNIKISNFFNADSQYIGSLRFFYISDSSLKIEESSFFYNNMSMNPSMFFEIRTSQIFISDSFCMNSKTLDLSILSSVDSFLDFYNVSFIDIGGTYGSLSIKTSSISINKCLFLSNQNTLASISDDQASDIIFNDDEIVHDYILIMNSRFTHGKKNALVIHKPENLTIINTIFQCDGESQFSRALYLEKIESVSLINCSFEGFIAELGGAMALYHTNDASFVMNVTIYNCSFNQNEAFFGGTIYIRGFIIVSIKNSIFMDNIAAITNDFTSKVLQSDTGKGGCIISDSEYYFSYGMSVENCIFVSNGAQNFGPTILSKGMGNTSISFRENLFYKNWDSLNFTSNISSSPINVFLLSSNFSIEIYSNNVNYTTNANKTMDILEKYEIDYDEIASGQEFNFSMILTDNLNQTLLFESKALAELACVFFNVSANNYTNNSNATGNSSSNYQNIFIDKGSSQASDGIFTFSSTRILMTPNNNLSCLITTTFDDTVFFKSTLEMGMNGTIDRTITIPWTIYVRNCILGEVLMEDHTCFKCLPGTYLFEDPMNGLDSSKKCNNCPDNAYCKGGKYLSPLAGYWRFSDKSTLILECPTYESCLGIGKDSQHLDDLDNMTYSELVSGKCHPNYWGNLCYACTNGYARFNTNQNCEICSSLVLIYIKMAFSLIFIVGYIAIQAKIFSNIDKKDPNLAIMMKLLLNHFQTISMINLVDLGWTVEFNFYFSLLDYLSFLSQDFFIIDCLVQNIDQNLLVQKIIFTILLPIILSLLMITIWMLSFFLILYRRSRQSQSGNIENDKFLNFITEKMRITLLILVFILYPEILRKCFSLLNCLLIDDSEQYTVLTASPNVRCWDGDHTAWVLTVSLPGLLIWGVFTPVIIVLVLRKYKNKIQNFIFETHKNFVSNKIITTNKKKETVIQKKILIDIETSLKNEIFEDIVDFPLKNEIKYKRNGQIFSEFLLIQIKEKNQIINEMKEPINEIPEEIKTISKNIDLELTNSDKLIKSPEIFFEYLTFCDHLKHKTLSQEELANKLIRLREEFSSVEKEDFENESALIKSPKTVGTIMPKTYLVIKNLGFIYRGYRHEFYFWEAIMFTRKFLLIFIGVFTEFFPKKTKPTMLIIILVGYIYIQIKYKPYQFSYLNKLEAYSLIVAFLTGNIGILLFSDFMQGVGTLFLLIVFGINVLYLGFWVKCLLTYGNLKEKIKELIKTLRIMKKRFMKSLFG